MSSSVQIVDVLLWRLQVCLLKGEIYIIGILLNKEHIPGYLHLVRYEEAFLI